MSDQAPTVGVIGGKSKTPLTKGTSSFYFDEGTIQVKTENQQKRTENKNEYNPTYYVSVEESTPSMVEIQHGEKKATNKIFGIVIPGSGLTITTPGVIEVKVGKGLKINPSTKSLELSTDEVLNIKPGDNIDITEDLWGAQVISVKGEDSLLEGSIKVPTSRAISSYTRTITGNLENLSSNLKEPGDTTLVDVLNTLHKRDHYTHSQLNPTTEWVIDHPLKKKPSVTITDETGEEMIGDVIYPSLHQVIVRFSAGFSGSALLN